MQECLAPGVDVEEIEIGAQPIEGVSEGMEGFLGPTGRRPKKQRLIKRLEQF